MNFNKLARLNDRLEKSLASSTEHRVLVSWEYKIAEQVIHDFLVKHSVSAQVLHWHHEDFDAIYIISQKK